MQSSVKTVKRTPNNQRIKTHNSRPVDDPTLAAIPRSHRGKTHDAIVHSSQQGVVVLAFDGNARLLSSWTTMGGSKRLSMGCRHIGTRGIEQLVREQLQPQRVWSNDFSKLTAAAGATTTTALDGPAEQRIPNDLGRYELHAYDAKSLSEVYEMICANLPQQQQQPPLSNVPSYAEIKALDSAITYKDYRFLYGR